MIAAKLNGWLADVALPFWAQAGVDAETGAFQERFTPDCLPDLTAQRRLRVQARQIYVFSHAATLGLSRNGAEVGLRAFDRLMTTYWAPDGAAGFVQALNADGTVASALRDSYDHAFVTLALAWLFKATGEARVEAALAQTLRYVDQHLTDAAGALHEDDRRSQPRRQNPQMHWFEAMLALKKALDHPEAVKRLRRSYTLFQDHFFNKTTGMLVEYYDDHWNPVNGENGDIVEPGHLAEWSWLLRQAAPVLNEPTAEIADRLLANALPHAAPKTGVLWDEITPDGAVRLRSSRSWPMTELAKACLAKAASGDQEARGQAEAALRLLQQHFLGKPFPAGWLDRITEDGTPVSQMVSASTLYHIFVAVTEAGRILR